MKRQPNSDWCFVCGRKNPVGLRMVFHDDGQQQVYSRYTVAERYQGYPGVVHGGIIAAMLDEVVARVSMIDDPHRFMMSVRLDVRYRHPVPVGEALDIVARIVRLRDRLGKAEGTICLPDGTVACEAEITLANIPAELLSDTNRQLLGWRVDD